MLWEVRKDSEQCKRGLTSTDLVFTSQGHLKGNMGKNDMKYLWVLGKKIDCPEAYLRTVIELYRYTNLSTKKGGNQNPYRYSFLLF